jgi:hypothetical protein
MSILRAENKKHLILALVFSGIGATARIITP